MQSTRRPLRPPLPRQGGVWLIDKAEGMTSHDVVSRARRALGTRKVGHAGTLDPMATGLLLVGVGPATRLLTFLVGLDKHYLATIRLGATTSTDDREGEVVARASRENMMALAAAPESISHAAARFTGTIQQVPSSVSAIKIDGKRAYDRVRSGETVDIPSREVTVTEFALGEPQLVDTAGAADKKHGLAIDVEASVTCSSGTYVRSLARDLGAQLDVGGHLTALRRDRVGPFAIDQDEVLRAQRLQELAERGDDPAGVIAPPLLDPVTVCRALMPVVVLDDRSATDLALGRRPRSPLDKDEATVAAVAPNGELIGVASSVRGELRVVANFPAQQQGANS